MPLPISDNGSFTTAKSLQFMKNRNNISRSLLARELTIIEKSKLSNLGELAQNCLDLKSFMKQVKYCSSDQTPEARHWLKGEDVRCHRHGVLELFGGAGTSGQEGQQTGDGQTGDAGATGGGGVGGGDLTSGDDLIDDPTSQFRKGAPPADSHLQYISIFSRRNEYGDLTKDKNVSYSERRKLALHSQNTVQFLAQRSSGSTVTSPQPQRVSTAVSSVSTRHSRLATPAQASRSVNEVQDRTDGLDGQEDWMKSLLLKNEDTGSRSKHRRRRTPLKDRISKFYSDIDHMKTEQRDNNRVPDQKLMQRKWIALTQGVDAALAQSSDEEEDNMHTI